jgi:hypothetical protein
LTPAAARQAGADPGLAGVEERDDAELLQRRVQRVVRGVVRLEVLQARVELEAPDAVLGHQPAGLVDDGRPAARVDGAERDQDVAVRGGRLGHVLAGDRRVAHGPLGVDGEDHRGHRPLAVVRGDLVDRRRAVVGAAEVRRRRGQQLVVQRQVPGAVRLDVDVHVDGGQPPGVRSRLDHHSLLAGRTSALPRP